MVANPRPQADTDNNGVGDACEPGPTADLEITVRPQAYVTPAPGARATLEVTVQNSGPNEATDASIQLQRLATFDAPAGTTEHGTFDAATGRWRVGKISKDEPAVLFVSGTVDTGGCVRASIATLDQIDPDATIGSPAAGAAGVCFGGGPGRGAIWAGTTLNGIALNAPPIDPGDSRFWCPADENTFASYDSQCLSFDTPSLSSSPIIEINPASAAHYGPGRLLTFLVNVASQKDVLAPTAEPITNAVVLVPIPVGSRFVAAQFEEGINSAGASSYDPGSGLWRSPAPRPPGSPPCTSPSNRRRLNQFGLTQSC